MSAVPPGSIYSVEYEVNRIPKPSDYPFHCNTTKNAKNICIHFDVHVGESDPPSNLGRRADVYFDMILFRVFAKLSLNGLDKWVEWSVDRLPHPFVPKYHLYFNPQKGYIWAHIDTIRDFHYSNPSEVYPGGKVGIQISLQMRRTTRQRQPVASGQKRRNEKITWMPSTHPFPSARSRTAPIEENMYSNAMHSSNSTQITTFHNYSAFDNHMGPVVTSHSRVIPRGEYNSLDYSVCSSPRSSSSSSYTSLPSRASLISMNPPIENPEGPAEYMSSAIATRRSPVRPHIANLLN